MPASFASAALADIKERLAAVMGRPGGPLAGELADLAVITLDLLDVVEGDPEAEPDGSDEPYVGGSDTDLEGDTADDEPSLGWLLDGRLAPSIGWHDVDCEDDPAEHGIADHDGLQEQTLRALFGDAPALANEEADHD